MELVYHIYLILALEVIYSEQNTGSTYIHDCFLISGFRIHYITADVHTFGFLVLIEIRNLVGIFRDEISC